MTPREKKVFQAISNDLLLQFFGVNETYRSGLGREDVVGVSFCHQDFTFRMRKFLQNQKSKQQPPTTTNPAI